MIALTNFEYNYIVEACCSCLERQIKTPSSELVDFAFEIGGILAMCEAAKDRNNNERDHMVKELKNV